MRLPAVGQADRALVLPALAYAGAVLLHVDRAPLWCTAVALLALLWRAAAALRATRLPTRWLRIAITLTLTLVTFGAFRTLNGLAAGSALLLVMGAVKLLESRARRDGLIIAGVALFLLAAACLDRQSLPRLPLYALQTWLACAALTALGGSAATLPAGAALRAAGKSLLLALPFALIVFLFFPRLPGALWAMPANEQARTGLTEEMSPGSISELTISDAIAFRVNFAGTPPPPAQRYWRGPVLHEFDGYTWRRIAGQFAAALPTTMIGAPLRYHVMLEPTQQNWWFALDTVARSPSPRVLLTFDQQLLSTQPVVQPVSYDAESYLQTRSQAPLSALARRVDLRLPPGRNPRSTALAQQLRARAGNEADYARLVLEYFRTQGFEYTLTPPLLDLDSIDDLLFNTRKGFCGHYASAYAMLMRAAGIPARVVTGYQGGEWNSVGGYYAIRQSDAHAWTEIWLDGRGWIRVDPTAVVSPERLQRGLRELLPDSGGMMGRYLRGNAFFGGMRMAWDASNRWWQEKALGYNLRAQLGLLDKLGLPDADYRQLALLLTGGCAAWMAFLLWQLRTRRAPPAGDALGQAWQQLRQALGKAGLHGLAGAGPLDLAQRAGAEFPELQGAISEVARRYIALRYEPQDGPSQDADALAQRIRTLLPRLKPHQAQSALPILPAEALAQLRLTLPLYRKMPPVLRQRCAALAVQLQRRVRFEGCGGLLVTAAMRNLIAFQASLLVVNRGIGAYRELRSVLVYPDEFLVPQRHEDEAGVVTEGDELLSGQTQDTGRILISWADVLEGLGAQDGYNVVLHEFAHLLDHAVGGELSRRGEAQGSTWHDVMETEYAALCATLERGLDTLIDPYGAEDPAEFFAVCTETFFELPGALCQRHPPLYATLRDFYGVDPALWGDPVEAGAGSLTR